jgi:hypothetical protein
VLFRGLQLVTLPDRTGQYLSYELLKEIRAITSPDSINRAEILTDMTGTLHKSRDFSGEQFRPSRVKGFRVKELRVSDVQIKTLFGNGQSFKLRLFGGRG